MPDSLLAHLAGADVHDRVGEYRDHLGGLAPCGLLVGLGEVVVADNDGGLIAQRRGHRRPPAPRGRAVDDVVVHERGCVDQLDGHRSRCEALELVLAHPRGEQHQGRAHAFAARREEVRHRRRHHVGVLRDRLLQLRLDRREAGCDGPEDVQVLCAFCCSQM